MSEFLLELMVEEIPAGMQVQAEKDLAKLFLQAVASAGVNEGEIVLKTSSTPARLVLEAQNLPEETADQTEEKRGPRVEAAYDPDGNPSKALQGFMASNNIDDVENLEKRSTDKGEFFFATKVIKGQKMADLLAENLPKIITAIPWPKSMRWGAGSMAFVRPIENIMAVLNGQVVAFEVAGLCSNNKSRGHFFLSKDWFDVKSTQHYLTELLNRHVILNRDERKAHIAHEIKTLLEEDGLAMVPNEKLVAEVAGLVEYPQAVLGDFDKKFLDLPREVLEITMASHQRFFAVEDENGDLANKFIAISNIKDAKGHITKGYKKVLTARFADAAFYWQQDLKQKLADKGAQLGKIVFHKKLGTLAEKTKRITELVETVAPYIPNIHQPSAVRAAQLSKCDLTTGVVYEFPELQGIMGHYYAQKDGEEGKVSHAIFWQYEHTNLEGLSPEAVALILADRLDTLVGFFAINEPPTGSKDPFALRRAAISVLRILKFYNIHLPLAQVLGGAYAAYTTKLPQTEPETVTAIKMFMADRLKVMLREDGLPHDTIEAVLKSGVFDVVEAVKKAKALEDFLQTQDGTVLKETFRRAHSILQNAGPISGEVEKSLLAVPEEKELFTRFEETRIDVKKALENGDYSRAMAALALMQPSMNSFFEGVMVMAKEAEQRQNRLALLAEISEMFRSVAAFEELGGAS